MKHLLSRRELDAEGVRQLIQRPTHGQAYRNRFLGVGGPGRDISCRLAGQQLLEEAFFEMLRVNWAETPRSQVDRPWVYSARFWDLLTMSRRNDYFGFLAEQYSVLVLYLVPRLLLEEFVQFVTEVCNLTEERLLDMPEATTLSLCEDFLAHVETVLPPTPVRTTVLSIFHEFEHVHRFAEA